MRGISDATAFNVYINVPEGENPANHPDNLAGSVALFGVRKASAADDKHAGDGLTYVLDISSIIDRLHLSRAIEAGQIHVLLVPRNPVAMRRKSASAASACSGRAIERGRLMWCATRRFSGYGSRVVDQPGRLAFAGALLE